MILPTILFSLLLVASSTEELLSRAQENMNQQKWQLAADALDELAITSSPRAEIFYDRGIAHYELGSFETAANSFERAMVLSQDDMLSTYSAFNFGNAIFEKTMSELEGTGTATSSEEAIQSIEKAKSQIKKSLRSYRSAISIDRNDMDARANGEFAWNVLKNLDQMQDQIEEQQKEQQQQQQDEQEQTQDEQSADEQEKNQQNRDEGESEEEQQKQQDGEQSQEQQKQQDGEQSEEQQKQQDGEQSQEQQKQQDGEQSEEQQKQQDGEQSEEQQKQQDGEQSEEDSSEQDISEGELETTDAEQEDDNAKELKQQSVKEDGKRLSKEEANRLLQLIRDKEQQRRKVLAARRAAKRVPVEKDW
ncbi:MAG TPA: hypothetical protein EYM90_06125 [Phycisphaerales bacterium]|nr:hypothetical protein [Phycisphaerales bacterium]HIO52028.1 hypothetical protein [Phycisphaerales bacterium]